MLKEELQVLKEETKMVRDNKLPWNVREVADAIYDHYAFNKRMRPERCSCQSWRGVVAGTHHPNCVWELVLMTRELLQELGYDVDEDLLPE